MGKQSAIGLADARRTPALMMRTKIVATMGPAVADPAVLRALIIAGVDVCRLNFSHGDQEWHELMLRTVRQEAAALDKPIAVLGDLGGPKIRLGEVVDETGGGMAVSAGEALVLQREPILGRGGVVSSTYPGIVDDVQAGDRVLIEDGLIRFVCAGKDANALRLQCTAGGVLKSRKGINLPNTRVKLPSLTQRDSQYVEWAIQNELDYLALSFVRRADELVELRRRLGNSRAGIIAKIEKAEALEDIDAIIDASDGLMIARGDLGVEVDLAQVPIIQKELIRRCRRAGKPVIVATQMLGSMVENSSPSRAEVSDVANAIFEGTDAVMLSGETSIGKFPVGAVHTMAHVADAAERYLASQPAGDRNDSSFLKDGPQASPSPETDVIELGTATARAVRRLVEELDCRLVVVYSKSGQTARLFAEQRFAAPVVALCDDSATVRQLNLNYGVMPIGLEMPRDAAQMLEQADALVQERELASHGDRIMLVAGRALGAPGSMNGILIHTVGSQEEA